jgi:shikimate kinase
VSVILLIGARGSGKTAVGSVLATLLGRPLVDLDEAALALTGLERVSDVFEQAGEHAWRQAEAAALEDAIRTPRAIIATGGGVPCVDPPRVVLQRARGEGGVTTVWLRCTPEVLAARLAVDLGDRPSLTGGDPVQESVGVAESRASLYAAAADLEVDGDGSIAEVAEAIAAVIA